jgi:selenide, water dikinase
VGPLDDAAVVRPFVGEGGAPRSMVLTIDVITPIVDDPRAFGGIAAANALSDVYAMGGRPEVALSFVGFPTDKLPLSALAEIMAGLAETCGRAGAAIVGGHSLVDPEPKAGLAVIGSVNPLRVWSHRSAVAGQALVLTKALGTGLIGQSIRASTANEAHARAAVLQMLTLNDRAAEIGLASGATSCTDVTGFGLLGHLRHVLEASNLSAELEACRVPRLEGALELAAAGAVPGGTTRNLAYAAALTTFATEVPEPLRLLLADAQTSGGLLLCLPETEAEAAVRRLVDEGAAAARIGTLVPSAAAPAIHVKA